MSRCGTCSVTLGDSEGMRSHYASELHLSNVRRRVEGLRPLTQQEFRSLASEGMEGAAVDDNGAPVYSCTLCKKAFHSVQTLQTHIRSTAHLMRKEQRIIARDSEAASMLTSTSLGSAAMGLHRRHNAKKGASGRADATKKPHPKVDPEEREEDTSEVRCMFCGLLSADTLANLHHLEHVHHFTIPLAAHCIDQAALLRYLARKVNGLMCIVCNERTRSFSSLGALRDHMRESNHESLVLNPEYQEFYDVTLEDPAAAKPVQLEGVRGDELLVGGDRENGRKRVVLKREGEVPRARPRETEKQTEQRMAILATQQETRALAKQEQRAIMASQNKDSAWVAKRSGGDRNELQLDVSMRTNKLHPKGYDGNMMFS